MRFRKSVKICKGVRVNFSKSGISTTVGMRGLSVNVGKKGTYLNTGIPGTGLYDRHKISGGSSRNSNLSRTTSNSSTQTISTRIDLNLDDNGVITFYRDGNIIEDQSLIRKIKNTPEFKAERERMMKVRFDEINEANNKFIEIYKLTPEVLTERQYTLSYDRIKLEQYEPKTYIVPAPTESQVKEELTQEAVEKIKTWKFWDLSKLRKKYVDDNFSSKYSATMNDWNTNKEKYESAEKALSEKKNAEYLLKYNTEKENTLKAINGEPDYIEFAFEDWLATVTLPVDFDLQYEYNEENLYIDLDLPEIEDLPQEKAVSLANGTTKKKAKTQKELKEDYVNCVFGLAMFFAGHLFNVSPKIKNMIISGYTQRSNTTISEPTDEYVYSIKFTRDVFENQKIKAINKPYDFCMTFENRCSLTSTLILRDYPKFCVKSIQDLQDDI